MPCLWNIINSRMTGRTTRRKALFSKLRLVSTASIIHYAPATPSKSPACLSVQSPTLVRDGATKFRLQMFTLFRVRVRSAPKMLTWSCDGKETWYWWTPSLFSFSLLHVYPFSRLLHPGGERYRPEEFPDAFRDLLLLFPRCLWRPRISTLILDMGTMSTLGFFRPEGKAERSQQVALVRLKDVICGVSLVHYFSTRANTSVKSLSAILRSISQTSRSRWVLPVDSFICKYSHVEFFKESQPLTKLEWFFRM